MPPQEPPHHLPRVLISAGPTHEPIDNVRFLGNRSSGRMGAALARACARGGCAATVLLGPVCEDVVQAAAAWGRVERFVTTRDLREKLREEMARADVLIMAAAVADFSPVAMRDESGQDLMADGAGAGPGSSRGKVKRASGRVTIELEATPDLLAEVARGRRERQVLVGFALEAREGLEAAARAKMERKGVDMIVANPLETMESGAMEGLILRSARVGGGSVAIARGSKEAGAELIVRESLQAWKLSEGKRVQRG